MIALCPEVIACPPRVEANSWSRNFVSLSSILTLVLSIPALGQDEDPNLGEYGDAPEGQEAYPWLGTPGLFPTCLFGSVLAAGVYFVKMLEGENVRSRKVVLVK